MGELRRSVSELKGSVGELKGAVGELKGSVGGLIGYEDRVRAGGPSRRRRAEGVEPRVLSRRAEP